jgi:hypothetical protein
MLLTRTAQSVQQRATVCATGVRFLARTRDFSLLHSVYTGSVALPASHPVGSGGSFPGGKATGA